ncbi:MAG: ABC transporter ATP-binding protein [Ilumatobacteraceae bacterium]
MPLLEVDGLVAGYSSITVLHGISLSVEAHEVVCLLGANGAGKSTTLMTISGVVPVTSGRVMFAGTDITGYRGHAVARLGLAHVPEGRRVFSEMTVEENLLAGAMFVRPKSLRRERLERSFELFPRLRERRGQLAGSLSGGEQQMTAIARALMSDPAMVMFDEPSLGLSPALVDATFETITNIARTGVGVLLVEQNAGEALEISDRAYVLEQGAIVLDGVAADLANDERVREAYLGV